MKTNKFMTLSLVAAGLSMSAMGFTAHAASATGKPDSQALFKKLDTDNDGQLTAAEMTKLPEIIRQQRFDRMDANHDGKIDKSEFEALARQRADRMFDKMDKNSDGVITADELKPAPRHRSDSKPAAAKSDVKKHAKKSHKSGDCRHRGWRHAHRHRHGMPRTDVIFTRMDVDNDGYVSAQEWDQAWQKWKRHHHRMDGKSGKSGDQG